MQLPQVSSFCGVLSLRKGSFVIIGVSIVYFLIMFALYISFYISDVANWANVTAALLIFTMLEIILSGFRFLLVLALLLGIQIDSPGIQIAWVYVFAIFAIASAIVEFILIFVLSWVVVIQFLTFFLYCYAIIVVYSFCKENSGTGYNI